MQQNMQKNNINMQKKTKMCKKTKYAKKKI